MVSPIGVSLLKVYQTKVSQTEVSLIEIDQECLVSSHHLLLQTANTHLTHSIEHNLQSSRGHLE